MPITLMNLELLNIVDYFDDWSHEKREGFIQKLTSLSPIERKDLFKEIREQIKE